MDVRILDLDGGVAAQQRLVARAEQVHDLGRWGPRLRMACGWKSFRRFEAELTRQTESPQDFKPSLTFVGSGDFHHLSLALLRRVPRRCNLLVIDNHPDWMRGVPFLHCGTWVYHAAQLPWVNRVFHVGGEVDFDNLYRWMAPWPMLETGKIVTLPALRRFRAGNWPRVDHESLRILPGLPAESQRIARLIAPYEDDLAELPLYVSLDRDVLAVEHAAVNWDSGYLTPNEVFGVLDAFRALSKSLIGMDVVGDWSPVRVQGVGRHLLDWSEHPRLDIDPIEAYERNEALNLSLVRHMSGKQKPVRQAA